ncbi:MAG: M24 family metallopeptidase [Dokdonella sp.]
MRMNAFLLAIAMWFAVCPASAEILPLREQARVIDEILGERFETVLPALMARERIDMWILVSREYNEDPVLRTMLPATWLNARRRTIVVFHHNPLKGTIEKLAVARYSVGDHITAAWDLEKFPQQWDALTDIVKRLDPARIAINISTDFGHADGLVHTEQLELMRALPERYKARIVSAQNLAVGWLETRTTREMQIYPQLGRITHAIIDEAFSEAVVTPGITRTDDVVWWLREKVRSLGLDTWFHPSVSIQRNDGDDGSNSDFSKRPADATIREGDLLHVDFGFTYLRLNTDVQRHAYVLRAGESTLPASIGKAFTRSNRVQDILTAEFAVGRSGNEILAAALERTRRERIKAVIYTHPLGSHGHAAGPTIGMWDQQDKVPGSGDYPMFANTVYSIELNSTSEIPEWKKEIRIMLEEDGFFDGKAFRYIDGRQREVLLIPRAAVD